uniref:VWFA domain-containing protein n=1 Tax=Echeneis naucrates TaxID=173247 RepID=A0A665U1F7_ECHNA
MEGSAGFLYCLIIAACFSGISAQFKECENATVADIVFIIDGSDSIKSQNFQEVRNFLRNVIKSLDIGPKKVQIGVAQYSNDPHQEFLLKDHVDKKSLLAAVDKIPYRGGGTETGKALSFAMNQYFAPAAGSRASQQVPQIAVVVTDGASADDVSGPAESLRAQGVYVYAIGVGAANKRELETIANVPPEHFLFTIDNYPALDQIRTRLLTTVCTIVTGGRIDVGKDKYADVFFLVDSKIPHGPIAKFKDELTKLIKEINVGISTHRFGLAQYAEDVQVHFKLNTHKTKQETLKGVQAFRSYMKPNQPHNLGHAMNYTKVNLLTHEAGGRAHLGYKQYLIAVSGNESDDPVGMVAKLLMADGVDVGSLSFGNWLIAQLSDNTLFTDCKGANVADVVFIVDESGSIEKTNFQLVRDFLHSMVGSLDVGLNRVRVGLVTYQDSTTAHIYLDTPRGKAEILQYISILPYSGGGTQTGAALNFTREQIFIETRGKRKGVQQVAVVITDGESQDRVSEAALNLRRDGVTIYCIGIRGAKISELEEMASHPSHGHIFNVESFTKLMPLKRELQKILCTNIIHEVDDADIFFLMDDSGSIGHEDFNDMKKFIIQLLKTFRIGKNHVRIGLVKYSDSPTLEFEPTTYSDVRALEKAVNGISHKGGGTKTGGALNDMIGHFDKAEASRGYKVPKYLIVITDGKSQDEVKDPADKIRAKDVIIHAIGVKDSNKKELEEIAGDPSRSHFVHNFDALPSLSIDITSDICSSDACKYVPLDIIFLVDSSGSISKKSYKTMKDFIKSLVSKSAIGKNDMHIAVMQFSSEPKMEFSLDTYYSQDEILKAIDAMQQMDQNTYTGKAIKEVSQYFSQSRGGRPGIGQRLLIITDGKAQDDVKVPAAELRAKNVVIYAIGVDRAETSQLKDLSGSQERVFYEKDFDELKQLENQLVVKLCEQGKSLTRHHVFFSLTMFMKSKNLIQIFTFHCNGCPFLLLIDCKKTERADIIFLVDGSTSISQTDFGSMQIFMKSFVEKATVGKDQTRFGVILYATTPASYFVLKDFESKRDVLTAISNITAPAGDTYTSAALKFSSQYFGAVHGGRKALKVPQILMVITDGEATDPHDLKPASDKLREDGVTVFSIGVKGCDCLSFPPCFSVSQTVTGKTMFPFAAGCTIDVAMGFDISRRPRAPGEMPISGHTKLQTFLPEIARYLSSVQGLCCVHPKDVETRMSYHVFNRNGQSLYDTNFEDYSEDAVKKVMTHLLSEPTYFNTALLNAFKEMFLTKSGANVKVLVIFSDGLDEDVMKLEQESELLRQSGVSALLTVALEKARDPAQLQMVEFGRGFNYHLPLSIGMPNVASTIFKQINSVSDRECCGITCKCSGHEGVRGSPGTPGSKVTEIQTSIHFVHDGERGPPGQSGSPGPQGCPGVGGLKVQYDSDIVKKTWNDLPVRYCSCVKIVLVSAGLPRNLRQQGE